MIILAAILLVLLCIPINLWIYRPESKARRAKREAKIAADRAAYYKNLTPEQRRKINESTYL